MFYRERGTTHRRDRHGHQSISSFSFSLVKWKGCFNKCLSQDVRIFPRVGLQDPDVTRDEWLYFDTDGHPEPGSLVKLGYRPYHDETDFVIDHFFVGHDSFTGEIEVVPDDVLVFLGYLDRYRSRPVFLLGQGIVNLSPFTDDEFAYKVLS